ncbi:MAG: glycosyltransferase family 2 protein [Alloprevotella sp.]|nr:glycosyltransferase family 2 protein [Alloprevotella sp.]
MDVRDNFSIVIPFYNRAKWLPATLASLSDLLTWPVELIFVDNQSTDLSVQLIERFMADNSQSAASVRLLSEPKRGAAAARNCGLHAATRPYVFFFDSDDEFSLSHLEEALPHVGTTDLILSATRMRVASGRITTRRSCRTLSPADQILTGQLSTQSMIFRTDFLKRIGGWNENLPIWNDWELGIRALKSEPRAVWLSHAHHLINQHANSITGTDRKSHFSGYLSAINAVDHMTLTSHERHALRARTTILAAELRSEKAHEESQALLQAYPLTNAAYKLLFLYARTLHKGSWWLYRNLLGKSL